MELPDIVKYALFKISETMYVFLVLNFNLVSYFQKKNKKQIQSDSDPEDLENLDVSDDETMQMQMATKKKGKSKKGTGMSAFAMLDMDDDDNSGEVLNFCEVFVLKGKMKEHSENIKY